MQRIFDNPYLIPILGLILGGILIAAAVGKLSFPIAKAEIVDIYAGIFTWLPYKVVDVYISVLPWLELLLGSSLVLGLFPRVCSLACLPIILSFIGANAALFRGAIEAHQECPACFGTMYVLSYQAALVIDIILCIANFLLIISAFWAEQHQWWVHKRSFLQFLVTLSAKYRIRVRKKISD